MNYWILKSEPETFSWEQMKKDKVAHWDGVRNHQAQRYLREMKIGDIAMFYHSGKERAIVGLVEISKEFHPDYTDTTGKFGMVDVKYKQEIGRPITLAEIKDEKKLCELLLVKQSRLSVIPINPAQWSVLAHMMHCNIH